MLNDQPCHIPKTQLAISVSELNRQARSLLERSFLTILVEGELSNFVRPSSGHWYFTLKDQAAQVRCAMFKNRNFRLNQPPKNGDLVRLKAKVSLYEGRGEYQLICEHLELQGSGSLQAKFEALKLKLQNEGLFSSQHKQPLPLHPKHLGIITSASGAAVHDILTVLERRFPSLPITLYPTAVQGQEAPQQICNAIAQAVKHQQCDVLILGRGGGSLEDLWAFNDEKVARAVFNCSLPIISAVGHEVDVVITDFIADVRAATPSAAAELISPDQAQLKLRLQQLEQRLVQQIKLSISRCQTQISHLKSRLRHPEQSLREQAQQLDNLELRLHKNIQHRLHQNQQKTALIYNRLQNQSPMAMLEGRKAHTLNLKARFSQAALYMLKQNKLKLTALAQQLNTVSPLATLERGYAIAKGPDDKVIQDATHVDKNDLIEIQLRRGRIQGRVENINMDKDNDH